MSTKKLMTKVLSVVIMASMLATSVHIPTYAEIADAGRAIAEGGVGLNAPDDYGSAESEKTENDAVAAGDEDNNEEGTESANEEAEAVSNSGEEELSQGAEDTASSSDAKTTENTTSSSSSNSADTTSNNGYNSDYSDYNSADGLYDSLANVNADGSMQQKVFEPFSTENDTDEITLNESFSLFSYYGASKTFTATAKSGDGNDIAWEVGDPKYVTLGEPKVEGDKSSVEIKWDGEEVEEFERTPFYAMLKSNPFERVTGTIYLSNGTAPEEGAENEQLEPGSRTEFESEEIRKFVEEMYAEGLTQDNSVYDLSAFGGTAAKTTAPDYDSMTDEEIMKLFEEKQSGEKKETGNAEVGSIALGEYDTAETFEALQNNSSKTNEKAAGEKAESDSEKAELNKEETQSEQVTDEKETADTKTTAEKDTEVQAEPETDSKVEASEKAIAADTTSKTTIHNLTSSKI